MVAAGPSELDVRRWLETVRVDVLPSDGQDGAAPLLRSDRTAVDEFGRAEGALCDLTPGSARFRLHLDDFGEESEGILPEALDRRPCQGIDSEEDGLTEPELIHSADIERRECPAETRRVATRHGLELESARELDFIGEAGEIVHLVLIGHHATLTGQVRSDPGEHETPQARHGASHVDDIDSCDAFAQVTQFDHQHDGVRSPIAGGGRRQRGEHAEFGVQGALARDDSGIDLAQHR